MPEVMAKCPTTDMPFAAGHVVAGNKEFKDILPAIPKQVTCPNCGQDHAFNPDEFYLAAAAPEAYAHPPAYLHVGDELVPNNLG